MTYTDGSIYDGWLKNGRREGLGTMTYADGAVYIGQWENNHRQLDALSETFPNNDIYERI